MKHGQKPLSDLMDQLTMQRKDVNVMVNCVLTLVKLDLIHWEGLSSPFELGRQIIRDFYGH
jgi:hypothetical protein